MAVNPVGVLYQRIRRARAQATRVVGDVRDTGATCNQVNSAIVRALRNGGRDLRVALSWP